MAVAVKHGGKYRFGAITSNLPRFMSGGHLAVIARFKPGELYRKTEVEDLRRAILATGLVAGVAITPRETAPPEDGKSGVAALDVVMSKAPLRTIAGEIGYDTGQGARIAASWEHRNLFPPEGALRVGIRPEYLVIGPQGTPALSRISVQAAVVRVLKAAPTTALTVARWMTRSGSEPMPGSSTR